MRTHCTRRRSVVALATPILLLLAAMTGLAPAHAVASASISGIVTTPDGPPRDPVTVTVHLRGRDGWVAASSTHTGDHGRYVIDKLEAGTYRIEVERYVDENLVVRSAETWYPRASSLATAEDVVLAEGAVVSGLDVQTLPLGHLSGTISGPDGKPLRGAYARLFEPGHDGQFEASEREILRRSDGTYTARNLTAGVYRIKFDDGDGKYPPIFNGGATTLQSAPDIVLDAGQSIVVDAQFLKAIRNTARPVLSGSARVGATLRASAGKWSVSTTRHTYEWLRDGRSITGATKATYRATRADVGSSLSVRVTASRTGHRSASAVSRGTSHVKFGSRTSARVTPGKGRAVVAVTVTASGTTPTGKVTVSIDKRRKTATLRNGEASVTLTNVPKGKRTVAVSYGGSASVLKSTAKRSVRIG